MKRGLTLVEVLVVMAVILVIGAIMFPVIGGARRSAKISACASQLSQIGRSMLLYAEAHDNGIPRGISGITRAQLLTGQTVFGEPYDSTMRELPLITELLKPFGVPLNLWRCPLDEGLADAAPFHVQFGTSYQVDNLAPLLVRTFQAFPDPSRAAVAYDGKNGMHGLNQDQPSQSIINCLFADTHVRSTAWVECTSSLTQAPL